MKRGILVVILAGLVLLLASGAYADTVSIGLQEAGVNGGAITTVSSGTGSTLFGGAYGTFNLNSVTAAGTPPLPEPELSTTSVNASSSTAGTLTVYVTEQGLGSPTGVSGFLSGFTSNVFSGSIGSVTEATYLDQGNGLFTTTTPLSLAVFTSIGSITDVVNGPSLSPGYSETEVFTIVASGTGNVNDTITLNQTPEPGTLTLFGSGLIGLAGLVRRKLAQA